MEFFQRYYAEVDFNTESTILLGLLRFKSFIVSRHYTLRFWEKRSWLV